jgi:transcriptional regulator with XRE-family HTH domain
MPGIDPGRLREARERRELRRETVAEAVGISHSSVIAYERGVATPSVRVLLALAGLYRVTVEELCTAQDDAPAGAA